MHIRGISHLKFHSQLSLKQVEDRLIITADFPYEVLRELGMKEPFLYVTLYARGGTRIKIIDEDNAALYVPTKKEFEQKTYNEIIHFAKRHSRQFSP
ncbi:hypothetical protein SAMN05192559_102418 [Halobacillus karajensis]|uniref:Uncharacterized protein n=1 Tax=Halobacillus karajensis TaxID=195088 RepID=A0A024P5A5_9BACI|nr:hypothetical protein [Halobacillus karajensis]CDQ17788.1 hypothetical protein BN982_00026 [Halobacillus karajensis]CDQ24194.1 hypothetical protein BN983_02466 [Halobacillus karajensis]CDQ29557.1 hypothetical protein BN981_03940 [Halobacillus karajensis]SEH63843.1 hypothetical protein SAMN05192559_102418 [Halobacillus karajensis]